MGEEKVSIAKIPWLWIILYVILLSLISVFNGVFSVGTFVYDFHLSVSGSVMVFLPGSIAVLVLSYIAIALKPSLGRRLNTRNLAFLYVATLMTLAYAAYRFPMAPFAGLRNNRFGTWSKWVPSFWFPSREVIEMGLQGGVAAPWIELVPSIAFWWIFVLSWYFLFTCFDVIIRKQWIEVEQLVYPYTMAAYNINAIASIKEKDSKRKFFSIGALMAIVFYLPVLLRAIFPWFPDIYGWYNPQISWTSYTGFLHLPQLFPSVGATVAGFAVINDNPVWIAVCYLLPTKLLFSVWVTWFAVIIVGAQIAYALGYYTGITGLSSGFSRFYRLRWEAPLYLDPLSTLGFLPSIIVFHLILNYRYIKGTLQAALKGSSDTDEALSYRWAYIGMLVSVLVLIGLLSISGLYITTAIIVIVVAFIDNMSRARIRGMSGAIPGHYFYGSGYLQWRYPNISMDKLTQDYVMAAGILNGPWLTDAQNSIGITGGAAMLPLESYRMAYLSNISARDIFKVVTVTAIIAPLLGIIYTWTISFSFGISKMPSWFSSGDWIGLFADPANFNSRPGPYGAWWPWALVGFLANGLISFMNVRYVWWPIDPIGVVLGTSHPMMYGLWFPYMVAWILKLITIRVGGTKLFESTGLPLAVGFIAGQSLASITGAVISTVRFFVPF